MLLSSGESCGELIEHIRIIAEHARAATMEVDAQIAPVEGEQGGTHRPVVLLRHMYAKELVRRDQQQQ